MTPTLVVTPTPSTTATPAVDICGNGILDPGEECDDGNVVGGDACAADCTSELIPGSVGVFGRRECFHEWLVPPFVARNKRHMLSVNLHCTDDDPQCDYGAASGDTACTFHVAMCFNALDVRRVDRNTGAPFCSGAELERVYLTTRLRFADQTAPDTTDAANRDAMEGALFGIGAAVRGECVRDDSELHRLCTGDADCASGDGDGNERCRGRFMAFVPSLTESRCTDFAEIVVPLTHSAGGSLSRGERWVRLRTTPSDDSVSGARRPGDTDILRLFCAPPR